MAQGSFAVLQKNLVNSVGGFAKFAAAAPGALATWRKIKDRQWEHGPQSIKDQAEVWEETLWKRHLCQHKNLWVDAGLHEACSQKELAQFHNYKMDAWRMAHWAPLLPALGGYALPLWTFWFANNTWVPSQFASTQEELVAIRKDVDQYRYKHTPAYLGIERWFYEFFMKFSTEEKGHYYDELFEKNTTRRDPKHMRVLADAIDKAIPFSKCRRKQLRAMGRAMGIPTFPMFGQNAMQARVKDYWEVAWNEDLMVIKGQLHKNFTDEELQDYAWRRFLSPYDKELSREQIMERLEDYFTYLGDSFVEEQKTPSIFITMDYCLGYYNEPSFLEGDIADLDNNDYDHMKSWGKDAFLKRLEFENGPLRDQVEAHSAKALAEREKKLAP